MPIRRKYGKSQTVKPRRKTMYRRRKRTNTTSLIKSFPSSGLPNSVTMKMVYAETLNFSASSSASNVFYRLNDLYDPYQGVGGHQPYYFDQMTPLYNHFIVTGCKVEVKASSITVPALVGMKAQPDTGALGLAQQGIERPYCRTGTAVPGGRALYMKQYFDISKLFGVSRQAILSDDLYRGSGIATPTNVYYLNIFHQPIDGASTNYCPMEIKLTYYVKWTNRVRQTQS